MEDMKNSLHKLNSIFKEGDEIYRMAAKRTGLPDCAFWILYTLRADGSDQTQSEICEALYQPKQTVNSALKKLEAEGYIALMAEGDRRSKRLRLTGKGLGLAEKTVDRVISRELKALSQLTAEEQKSFLRLYRKYIDLLGRNMQTLGKGGEE